MNNQNIFFKYFMKPIYLLFCLFVIRLLTLKLRLKATYLNLKVGYLSFKITILVFRKRKLLAENSGRAVFVNEFLNTVEDSHNSFPFLANLLFLRTLARRGPTVREKSGSVLVIHF